MKKFLSVFITFLIIVLSTTAGYCTEKITYDQPFDKGTLSSQTFRIPALYTLNDGSVMAAADMRYNHGSDSPNNIDISVAISNNGYTDWNYTVVNNFDDYADGVTEKNSASFIDSAVAQSSSGRIFIICDAFPSGGGYLQALEGTGYIELGGKKHMLLTNGDNSDKLKTFGYYIGDFNNSIAPVLKTENNEKTEYSVDSEFRLYKNNEPLYLKQKGSDGIMVRQNIFYNDSELCCYKTAYLWMRYSDDNGKSWSEPVILSEQVKKEKESFLGICPGRGMVVDHNGKERIIFCVYDNNGIINDPISENSSVIYSDDNGITWHRGNETLYNSALVKTSEAQTVMLDDNTIRMFARNSSNFIAFSDSTDGGKTWSVFKADKKLEGTENCMVSFINTSKLIDGKSVILSSSGGNVLKRADGVIKVGLVDSGNINWISTYHINSGFFAYSCLTELSDGNFAILYENEASHIEYMIFSVLDDGIVSEINSNNIEYRDTYSFTDKIKIFFKKIFSEVLFRFNLI